MGITQIRERFLKEFKRSPKLLVYLTVAAACIVVLLLMRTPDEKTPEPAPEQTVPIVQTSENYAQELERNLEEIISRIQGVGEVTVMLTVGSTEQKVFAVDTSESDARSDSETVIIGSKEALLQAIKYPEVRGVLVVCTGGDKAPIKEKVVNAVSTVLDIPASKVYVTNAK